MTMKRRHLRTSSKNADECSILFYGGPMDGEVHVLKRSDLPKSRLIEDCGFYGERYIYRVDANSPVARYMGTELPKT